ncbi:MAG: hypothetical protein IPL84_05245 [Chitinophagaceae bacterium]|nr:hypothetical protein [Chitinophagaceae bacterium]
MSEENKDLPAGDEDSEQAKQPEENTAAEVTAMPQLVPVESDKQPTINDKQETENMEVHHHSHSGHGKKTWKEYFWEFLMLFLAVFCGFLAEYQLEHTIEHQREKKFAGQMLSDLRADSLFFTKRIKDIDSIGRKHQELFTLMTRPDKATDKEILNATLAVMYIYDIQATTATYEQMKTSGSLRYIQNKDLTNVIQQYYAVSLPRVLNAMEIHRQFFNEYLNPYFLKHFRIQDFNKTGDSLITDKPVILYRTTASDQELLNIFENYGRYHETIKAILIVHAFQKLQELITLLKKEYHLD